MSFVDCVFAAEVYARQLVEICKPCKAHSRCCPNRDMVETIRYLLEDNDNKKKRIDYLENYSKEGGK